MAIQDELWWTREEVTPAMSTVGLRLRAAYGVGADAFGIKGNAAHTSGGHRSQEWLRNSAYCTNRTYTVQAGLSAEEARFISAFDFVPGSWGTPDNRAKMRVLTKRLIDAMKAGRLNEVVEVFGTLDGVHVTGYNNDSNSAVTSDSSHLDHVHVRTKRQYADDGAVMARIVNIMLGENEMTPGQEYKLHVMNYRLDAMLHMRNPCVVPAFTASDGSKFPGITETNHLGLAVVAADDSGDPPPPPVDLDAIAKRIADEVAAQAPTVEAIAAASAKATVDEIAS